MQNRTKNKMLAVRLDDYTYEQFRIAQEKTERSTQWILERAVKEYIINQGGMLNYED